MQGEDDQPSNEKDDEYVFDWKSHYLKFDAFDHKQKLEDALAVIKVENDKIKADQDKTDKDISHLTKEIETLAKEMEAKIQRERNAQDDLLQLH